MKAPVLPFIILLLCFMMSACNEEEKAMTLQEGITVIAQLKIGPAIEQEESPMSRNDSRATLESGVYAINIFWKGKGLTSYQPYASGLYDNISNVRIGLIVGYEYRFDCTFLLHNELPYKDESGKYGRPFSLTKDGLIDAEVTNKLKVSINPLSENAEFHQLIYDGDTQINADVIAQRPVNQHRYYGCATIDFRKLTATSPTATIELKRAYYTLRFSTNKELREKDSIKITTDYTDPFYLVGSPIRSAPYTSDTRLFTMKTISDIRGWGWDGGIKDKDPMSISVYYRPAEANQWTTVFTNTKIELKRNMNNVLNIINIDTGSQGNGNISLGDGEIGGSPTEDNESDLNKQ